MARPQPLLVLAALMPGACHKPAVGETGDSTAVVDTGARALDVSCVVVPQTLSVAVCDWSTPTSGVSWVEFGETEALGFSTPRDQGGQAHHFSLYGMPAGGKIYWKAATQLSDGLVTSSGALDTLLPPADFPAFQVTILEPDLMDPTPFFLGTSTGAGGCAFVVDRQGRAVWYYGHDRARVPAATILQSVDVLVDPPRLLLGAFTVDLEQSPSVAFDLALEGFPGDLVDIGRAHHTLQALPDGGWAWLASEDRTWIDPGGVGWSLLTDQVVERAADGTVSIVFDVMGALAPQPDGTWTDPTVRRDWSHANTLVYAPDNDTYLVTLGYLDRVVEVSRATGAVVRDLGAEDLVGESRPFIFPHSAAFTDEGTLLLTTHDASRTWIYAAEYAVDGEALRETWSWGDDQGLVSPAGGQVFRLPNGNTLFNAGAAGVIQEVTPGGQVAWEVRFQSITSWFVKLEPLQDFYGIWGG